jgi:hypothetical protein
VVAISLKTMKEMTLPVKVSWGDEEATVMVRPGAMTRSMLTGVNRNAKGLNDGMRALIESWEVLDDKGDELPVTDEVLNELPTRFLNAIVEATIEAIQSQGKASGAT